MNIANLGLKTKITLFILSAVYLPLITLTIFSETYGELNRRELIQQSAKGQVKSELIISKSQLDYIYRTMKEIVYFDTFVELFDHLKSKKIYKNKKKDPLLNKLLDKIYATERNVFPKRAPTYYGYDIYLEDGTSLLSLGKEIIGENELDSEVNFNKFPEVSPEKKAEVLNDFKNLEPNVVYYGNFKVLKKNKARTTQGVKIIYQIKDFKILVVGDFLLYPAADKVPRLYSKELKDKVGIYIFDENDKRFLKGPKTESYTIKELLPGAPLSFFEDGITYYDDPKGNLFVKGEHRSEVQGLSKITKIIYFPSEVIYGPWDFFSNALIGIIVLFGLLTVLFLLYFLKKYFTPLENILNELQVSSKTTKDASSKLEATSTALAESSLETSSGMENILKSMEKINSTQIEIKKEVEMADSLAEENTNTAKMGEESNNALIKSISELSKAAENIGPITDIIEDISFQTNLLSLNASVEAARAGEQGKGFGVVAGSIRELSGKTSDSAKDISELISEAIKKSKQGFSIANQNSEVLSKIMNNISKVNSNVEAISKSIKVQSDSVMPLNEGLDQIHKIFQISSKYAIACNKISSELGDQTKNLEIVIEQLTDVLKGKS